MARVLSLFAALAVASASAAGVSWDSCGTQYDRLVTSSVDVVGSIEAGNTVTVNVAGSTMLHEQLTSGAWQIRVYELGQAHAIFTTFGDLMTAVTFSDQTTKFTMKISFPLPAKTTTGVFTASLEAVDAAKAEYMCLELKYAFAAPINAMSIASKPAHGCKTDLDCPSSYCMNDASHTAPYTCHTCGDSCCLIDADCAGSYCARDRTKMPPFFCHGASAAAELQALASPLLPSVVVVAVAAAPAKEVVAVANAAVTWDSCGTRYDRLHTVTLTAKGVVASGNTLSIEAVGTTDLHAQLTSGAWSVRVYEEGQAHAIAAFDGDLMSAVKFNNPPTSFTLDLAYVLPAKTATGKFTASITAVDEAKAAFLCLEVKYTYASASAKAAALIAKFFGMTM